MEIIMTRDGLIQADSKKHETPTYANNVLAAVRLAKKVIDVLDKKCRNGCTGEHYTWVGFQNEQTKELCRHDWESTKAGMYCQVCDKYFDED